jgi:peptidyl-prolyl cis-trans isomerase D
MWGIQNYMDTGKEQPAAVVGDREIFDRDVSRAYEQSLAGLVGVADYDEKQVRHEALERLIREELVYQAAVGKPLAASDEEVRGFIQSLPSFQTDGKFDKDKYKAMLAAQNSNPAQFAAQISRAIVQEQYQRGIVESAFVTPDQVDLLLRLKNQERQIEYATIPLKPSNRPVQDAEIEAYYREHPDEFRTPERVSVEFVALSLEELAKQVPMNDDDLRRYYEEQKASLGSEERRKVSHILIPVDGKDPAADQAALARINQVRERLGKGEEFAKLASEVSGDPASAKQGGDLGFIAKDSMDENFIKAAFSLKPGEVSEPVKTPYGYHLIKLTEFIPASVKSFDEAKEELKKTYQHNTAESKFYELGQTLAEQSYEHPDSLKQAAEKLSLKIEETGFFTREAGEGIAADQKVREAAFSEDVLNGRNSDPVELGEDKALVLRLKDRQAATQKPLAEVRDAIAAKLRDQEARREAASRVESLMQQIREGKPLAEAAKAMGLTVNQPPTFRRGFDKLPPELVSAVFKAGRTTDGKPVVANVELPGGEQAVYRLVAVKDGDPAAADAKERETTREFLSKTEGQREFAALVGRLREVAEVKVKPES